MTSFANLSRRAAACISLVAWWAPYAPLVCVFSDELQVVGIWGGLLKVPFAAGIAPAFLFLRLTGLQHGPDWIVWFLGILLPACFVLVIVRARALRLRLLIVGFGLACCLSWFAYLVLKN